MSERNNHLGWFIAALVAFACSEPIAAPIARITAGPAPADDPAACASPVTEVEGRIGVATPLSGACSSDPGGESLTYRWSLAEAPAGSESVIQEPAVPGPTFVPDVAGSYKLRLVVSNGVLTSKPAEVEISVNTCGDRAPVVTADAAVDSPAIGQVVHLDASATDEDTLDDCAAHEAEFSYQWSFAELPDGSRARLNDPGVRNPSFTPDVAGTYVLHVVSMDPTGKLSEFAAITVEAGACGGNAPVVSSIDAAPSDAPATGQAVQLGASVTDADSEDPCQTHAPVFVYDWQFEVMPVGSNAALNDEHASAPSFTPDVPGEYVLRVTATDPTGLTATEIVSISAGACGSNPPVVASIDAAPSAAPATGQPVQLGADVTDADLDAGCQAHAPVFTYDWQFEVMPAGSNAELNDPHASAPSFTPDVPGEYVLRVVATDPTGRASTELVTITASTCGSNEPTATASAVPNSVNVGAGVQLQGTAADADNDLGCGLAQTLSYSWKLVQIPAGSVASVSNPAAEYAAFTTDVAGTYVAELVVSDSTGRSSLPVQTTVTASACGTAAPVAAAQKTGPGATVSCGGSAIAIDLGGNNEVLLDAATSSDADNSCGVTQTLFYSWTLLSTPLNGGDSNLMSDDGRTTVLDVQSSGEYRVRLIVTDSTGRSSQEAVCILNLSNVG